MCDTMVVVGDGRVLFAKNSDRDPNEAQFLDWQPRRTHDAGSALRCTWIEVEQVADTNAVLLSRPFWMWGAEMGANEHGVVIGNEAVFTDQPEEESGLTGMDLLRLGLERASTADEAVAVIIGLLERYGQGGGCGHEDRSFTYHNSFIVADPAHAVVLETAGREWATEEVTSGARSISNGLTIPGFADEHSDKVKTHFSRCRIRQAITQRAADQATEPVHLIAALRDHGTGGPVPQYSTLTGAMSAPCMHAGGKAAASQTTASWVADLTTAAPAHWVTGTAAPCTSIFKPVAVTEPLDLGPAPGDTYDPETLWWRHELLHRRVAADPETLHPRFAAERDEVESRWLASPPAPVVAFAEADELLERWTTQVGEGEVTDRRPLLIRRYWHVRNRRAGMPERVGSRREAG